MVLEKIKAMQTGTKSKERNSKFGKIKLPRRDTINSDLSKLRKPIDTSISTLYHISKLLADSTDEIKSILTYECDIIYECRICRSLFRSIVNLISHKREYCREKFNITLHRNTWNDLSTISAIESAIDTCQAEQTIIKTNVNDRILRSQVSKETCKSDLTAVIDTLIKKQEDVEDNSCNESKIKSVITDASSNQHIYLRTIETNGSAVYQTVKSSDTIANVDSDLTAEEVMELQNTMQNSTTLEEYRNENQSKKSDTPTQADLNDEEDKLPADRIPPNSLVCAICSAKFSTKKTLTFHVKTLHTTQRKCYTCPCCTSTFANTWSVHRHLFKIHKKNHEQVRKLRLKIQEVPFDREATAMQDLKKNRATRTSAAKKIRHNNDLGNSDKAQGIYLESEMEDSSCNGCRKKFNTKTALSAHSQHCQAVIVACDQVTTKINRSDSSTSSDSVLNNNTLCDLKDSDASNSERTSLSPEIIDECRETAIRVQHVSTLNKDDWDSLECYNNHSFKRISPDNNNVCARIASSTIYQNPDDNDPLTVKSNENSPSKIVHENTGKTNSMNIKVIRKKGNTLRCNKKKRMINLKRKNIRVQQNDSASHSIWLNKTEQNLSMENKMAAITNLRKLQCLLCKRKFTSMTSLRRHIAIHIEWYRYRCKLCGFKCFFKCDCVAHCNKIHDAQNSHAFMAEMVIEIPEDEHRRNENIVTDITDVEEKTDEPDDADRIASSSQSEIREDFSCSSDTNVCEKNEETVTTDIPTEGGTNGTAICANLEEYMENHTLGKLDVHSDLKRMVMEVIFGSSDTESVAKQADLEKKLSDTSNEADRDAYSNNNENSTASTDAGLVYCSITDDSKPQRPMRKRTKPLSKDFIYDLKDIQFRRESWKGPSSFQLGKSSAKHSLNLCDSESLMNARKKAKLYNRALNSN